MRRIGVVGYGSLGRTLVDAIQAHPDLALAFVWNRTPGRIDADLPVLADLEDFADAGADLVAEVADPSITRAWAHRFLAASDYLIGSPTALADAALEARLRAAATRHGLYVPRGALPGLGDVLDMAAAGRLAAACITMRKHPGSVKWTQPLPEVAGPTEIYRGPVRGICPLAPNNVNTMAVLALASGRGFDGVEARFVLDPSLDAHIIEVELLGPVQEDGQRFRLELRRTNPAAPGAVTGSATHGSFVASMLRAVGAGPGLHLR